MQRIPFGQHFFSMTRGQVVLLLRRAPRTVEELTEELGLTRNAVREHLTRLERDGLVQRSGLRRGGGKPAHLYALSPGAADLFARGYAPVLQGILETLAAQLDPTARDRFLGEVGRRLANQHPVPASADDVPARLALGAELLNELGGLAEVREVEGTFVIQGQSCPLASVVVDRPELCQVPEAMLSALIGLPVHEHCDRSGSPRCCFVVEPNPGEPGQTPEPAPEPDTPR